MIPSRSGEHMTRTTEPFASDLRRAFWRWHFYAGLLVMPLLLLMAATGAAYLFKPEIEAALYRPMMTVEVRPATSSPDAWIAAATQAAGGAVTRVEAPAAPDRAVRMVAETPRGQRTIFVDPHDAKVLGSVAGLGVMDTVKRVHSLVLLGAGPNMLIEIVAGWAIVMVVTGVVLWWPKGGSGGVVTVRGRPGQRLFWRDLHAVTGLFAAAVILFLGVTGMPWSAVWGDQVRKATNAAGWGAPLPPPAAGAWGHDKHQPGAAKPWALEGMDLYTGHRGHGAALGLADAMSRAEAAGLVRPYAVAIPEPGSDKAWSVSRVVDRAEDARTLYLAGDDGRILADIGWAQYGPAAKTIQWGVATHQGQEYGAWNRWLMLAGCVAIWLLGVSSLVMWWKRRPRGTLAAPAAASNPRARWIVAATVAPLAIIYPLTGASLLVVLGLDFAMRRIRSARVPREISP